MYVELFGRPKFDILADLISQQNTLAIPLNAHYLTFGNVTGSTVPGNEDRVNVQVTGRSPITGQRTFSYTRIDLSKLMSSVSPALTLPETAQVVGDLLPLLKAKYQLFIDPEDIANVADPIPVIAAGATLTITLQTRATTTYNSHVWSGHLDVICSGGAAVASTAFVTEGSVPLVTE